MTYYCNEKIAKPMHKIFTLFFISQFALLISQKNIKMYNERQGDSLTFYVDNNEVYPVSLIFKGQP